MTPRRTVFSSFRFRKESERDSRASCSDVRRMMEKENEIMKPDLVS